MYVLKIAICVIVVVIIPSLIIPSYLSWKLNLSETAPRVSFKTFKTMYEFDPCPFILRDTWFKYNGTSIITTEFDSFIGMIKYKLFVHKMEKDRIKRVQIEETIELINAFQKDIDDYKKQHESELKKYSDAIIKQVKESTERYEKMKGDIYDNSQRSKTQNRTSTIRLG